MLIKLKWLEPEEGSWTGSVTGATEEELRSVQKWVRSQVGEEWGATIPSIRLVKGEAKESMSLEDFAATMRYSTGEEIYQADCPVLAAHGIARS